MVPLVQAQEGSLRLPREFINEHIIARVHNILKGECPTGIQQKSLPNFT